MRNLLEINPKDFVGKWNLQTDGVIIQHCPQCASGYYIYSIKYTSLEDIMTRCMMSWYKSCNPPLDVTMVFDVKEFIQTLTPADHGRTVGNLIPTVISSQVQPFHIIVVFLTYCHNFFITFPFIQELHWSSLISVFGIS